MRRQAQLDGGRVLPGFSCPVAAAFAGVDAIVGDRLPREPRRH